MTETETKKHKTAPSVARHQRDYKRQQRIKNKKCVVCGNQARWKDLLTQQMYCQSHTVAPLKEQIINEAKTKSQKPASYATNPPTETTTAPAAENSGDEQSS